MSEKYERTFFVAVPVERAWRAFTDDSEREAWMGTPPETLETGEIKVEKVDRHRVLSLSQSPAGLEGTYNTTVTFEETTSGTRITVVRSGFGDSEDWLHYVENTGRGWDEMIADLALYLEAGIRSVRHFQFTAGIGATMRDATAGVRITHVVPGGFAEQAGMQAGDILIRLQGAPVIGGREVTFVCRLYAPGDVIEAEYVRDGEVLRGSAPLSVWNYGDGEYVGHPGGYPKPALTAA